MSPITVNKNYMLERITVNANGCWEWNRYRLDCGYGRICNKGKYILAHRMAAHLWQGFRLSSEQIIRHRCDNPPCINPDHLVAGSYHDNVMDSVRRGRWSRNRRGPRSCSKAQIEEFRVLRGQGLTLIKIARQFNISISTVHAHTTGKYKCD